jgi:DNA polymerase IV (DinB-like DNA polymerase)
MLVDLDYFYAQVEERRNPSIKDKPVVVCVYSGRTEESGVVATANYIARKYSVNSGIPIVLAKKRLDGVDSVFIRMDHDYYKQVSDRIMVILKSGSDGFEQMGIDEGYLDISQRSGLSYHRATEIARSIKGEIKNQEGLTCSVGVGPNKLVAKIASDVEKPNGLTVVRPEEVLQFLYPLPVDRVVGVGRKTSERLELMGIRTIGELAALDVQRLMEEFGDSLGTYLHNASKGMDEDPIRERGDAESISRIATLKQDTRDIGLIMQRADQLCLEVHERLLQRGLGFKAVAVVAVMEDLTIRSRTKTFEGATDDLGVLRRAVAELFGKLLDDTNRKVRRAGVKVYNLVAGKKVQRELTSFF